MVERVAQVAPVNFYVNVNAHCVVSLLFEGPASLVGQVCGQARRKSGSILLVSLSSSSSHRSPQRASVVLSGNDGDVAARFTSPCLSDVRDIGYYFCCCDKCTFTTTTNKTTISSENDKSLPVAALCSLSKLRSLCNTVATTNVSVVRGPQEQFVRTPLL